MKLLGPVDDGTDRIIARRAVLSILAGSLVTLIPVVAKVPFLPPFGLMMLLGWRLLRPHTLPIWAAAPLGLFDDLVSGQPLGSAMLLWQLCMLMLDFVDTRMMTRDFWQDWLLAGGSIALSLVLGRAFATSLGAHVDTALLFQIIVSVALFPLATRLCTALGGREDE
ncbi:rod shape-determining protein MreD [Sphingomonas sp. Leaf407]|uniref:rod shape-determining protein MreD n=1 Tax=unclassified Sphingomonas TaxID=196159 RepID=UPI0006FA190E|nr:MULTISPECIES: rod shape-determining protein MreD [unclassified Sphingomonas]KQN36879.1 rod shape-determining protein MreD [Sphingomonas sp. Leaf42]KQT30307.1 rod shape-determining protein MreD [Sphingomonas sp. Leaf407]